MRDILEYLYLEGELSTTQIAGQFGVGQTTIMRKLVEFNIPRRTNSETQSGEHNSMYGKRSGNWKGGKTIDGNGYVRIYSPDHPHAHSKGYVLEHRLVIEKKLGRYLTKEEVIHHDKGKIDNDPEDLRLFENNQKHLAYERLLK